MDDPIAIRRAESVDDYRACQDAQRRAWGIADESYVVPIATMVGAQLHGGLVLGAFLPSGEAVGVSFAFLGRVGSRICLYSQLTGIVPGWQSHGLGSQLKKAQRELALADGVDLIAWAFDPLQAGNAHFNLGKLGASAGRYVDNMYGARTDALNAGVPTDRIIAEWELASSPTSELPAHDAARLPRLINTTDPTGRISVHPAETPRALVEIPDDIAGLRTSDPARAEHWRVAVREALAMSFASGYRAVGFVRLTEDGTRRGYYVLQRG